MQVNMYKDRKEFLNDIKKISGNGKIASLDLGEKKIGIALAGLNLLIATPHSVYLRQTFEKDMEFLSKFIKENFIVALIIGLPISLNGEITPQVKKLFELGKKLESVLKIPIYFEDESYTTKIANDKLIEVGLNRRQRNKIDDKISAMIILESFINHL